MGDGNRDYSWASVSPGYRSLSAPQTLLSPPLQPMHVLVGCVQAASLRGSLRRSPGVLTVCSPLLSGTLLWELWPPSSPWSLCSVCSAHRNQLGLHLDPPPKGKSWKLFQNNNPGVRLTSSISILSGLDFPCCLMPSI